MPLKRVFSYDGTPRHNDKVERQHRTDSERFCSSLRMYSLTDGRKQLAVYQSKANDHIKTCPGLRSPNQVLEDYLAVMQPRLYGKNCRKAGNHYTDRMLSRSGRIF